MVDHSLTPEQRKTITNDTLESLSGIGCAGCIYVVLVWCVIVLFSSVAWVATGDLSFSDFFYAAYFTVLGLGVGITVGFFAAWFAGMLFLGLVSVFNATMSYCLRADQAAGLAGGMTGYFLLALNLPVLLFEPTVFFWFGFLVYFFLGPVLAMFIGHCTAVYWVRKHQIITRIDVWDRHGNLIKRGPESANTGFQFSLRNLMVLTAWICFPLAILRLAGEAAIRVAIVLGLFLILHFGVAWLVKRLDPLFVRFIEKRLRKQAERATMNA